MTAMRDSGRRSVSGFMIAFIVLYTILFSVLLVLFTAGSADPMGSLAWLIRAHITMVLLVSIGLVAVQRWLVVGSVTIAVSSVVLLAELAVAYWLWSTAVTAV